ncbi:MBL fold metallo-hydrolase RNA specificity domain-containing protein [Quadrisphaera sp. GCM10027208]|uniref:MBL fold metallo-hydrolase RNA specificity domain-containing protein n=1 Tax=Quadrisphaera sp. GCM10027208 TaxID=3273423 RepID=UPI0036071D57
MATLTFLGGTGTVTGSKFLLEQEGSRLLVDCGLFQGLRELRRRNWEPLPLDPSGLAAVVLTHAHLDHCGYLPRLVRDGFSGPVLCTPDTAELVAVVLRDSAHLQEEDARYAAGAGYSKHHPPLPLYDAADAERAIALLRPTPFGERVRPAPGLEVLLSPAGHILGSATVLVVAGGRRVVFSGDLGRPVHALLSPPAPLPEVDAVVLESTYGDREHPEPDPEVLAGAIRRTVRRGGVVLVPAFAVDRTELVLAELERLRSAGEIPDVPVVVDSPMALASLRIYRTALREGHPDVRPDARTLLDRSDVREARTVEESMRLNAPALPCIIVSASGMAAGGRVVHHLKHLLPDPRNTVVLTGFQAPGTRGRDLLEGARRLKMHGRYVPVRAEVVEVRDFSCHADASELVDWVRGAPRPPAVVYVVHGEPAASAALADRLEDELGVLAVPPRPGEVVRL